MKKPYIFLGAALVAVLAAGGYYASKHRAAGPSDAVALATPPGITLQLLGDLRGSTFMAYSYVPPMSGYADAAGHTLYTYDKDEGGKSVCNADCAKAWPPATAPADAKTVAGWTLIARDDGSKQWAFKGKPLYSSVKDKKIGDKNGNDAEWHAAVLNPAAGIQLPRGLAIQEMADAGGQVLVDDQTKKPLYFFEGDAGQNKQVGARWKPVPAPQIANVIGDFSVMDRHDGIKQWAFKGRPLYTYTGDLEPGDVNGGTVDNGRWQVATVMRYFMPANVTIHRARARGNVLATADGMTLYRRNFYTYQTGGHLLRHGAPNVPAYGRDIGTVGCDAECAKMWHPLAAAADAQSSGYWDVLTRDDGSKQWAYKGYALYTFGGDKKPGDVTGYDTWDFLVNDGLHQVAATALPIDNFTSLPLGNAGALYWIYAEP